MSVQELQTVMIGVAGATIAGLFAVAAFFAKRLVDTQDKTLKAVEIIRLELARDYVRRDEMDKNDTSHGELRKEVTAVRERIAVVEATRSTMHGVRHEGN